MGYGIELRDADFKIRKSQTFEALQALKAFVKTLKNTYIDTDRVMDAFSLGQAMSFCRFELELSKKKAAPLPTKEEILKKVQSAKESLEVETKLGGNKRMALSDLGDAEKMLMAVPEDIVLVTGISFVGENQDRTEQEMFNALAPFVEPNSYIEMQGEDGEIWRWIFDGVTCVEKNAEINF